MLPNHSPLRKDNPMRENHLKSFFEENERRVSNGGPPLNTRYIDYRHVFESHFVR